jgi:hypothetical protein
LVGCFFADFFFGVEAFAFASFFAMRVLRRMGGRVVGGRQWLKVDVTDCYRGARSSWGLCKRAGGC